MAKADKPKLDWTTITSLPASCDKLVEQYESASKKAGELRNNLLKAIETSLLKLESVQEEIADGKELVVIPKFGKFIYAFSSRKSGGSKKGISLR